MKILTLFLIILTLSCRSSRVEEEEEIETEQPQNTPFTEMYCNDMYAPNHYEDSLRYNFTQVLSTVVVQNCICIKYQYSGCTRGEVLMVQEEQGTDVSQIPLIISKIWVKDAGQCEQLLTDSACFSLKRIYLQGDKVNLQINSNQHSVVIHAPQY